MIKKFIRRTWKRYSKLGLRRKKKQVWRRPTGRDNKMREKRRGYPSVVSLGYRTKKEIRGKIKEKKPIIVNNIKEVENAEKLEKAGEKTIIIIGKVGKKKKLEIAEKAKEKNLEVYNLNIEKFLKKNKK